MDWNDSSLQVNEGSDLIEIIMCHEFNQFSAMHISMPISVQAHRVYYPLSRILQAIAFNAHIIVHCHLQPHSVVQSA